MDNKYKLDYIEFYQYENESVLAEFHLKGSFFVFTIPIFDNHRSFDCLTNLFGILACRCAMDYHVLYRPTTNYFELVSFEHKLRLPFSSACVDKRCTMFYICKTYQY